MKVILHDLRPEDYESGLIAARYMISYPDQLSCGFLIKSLCLYAYRTKKGSIVVRYSA